MDDLQFIHDGSGAVCGVRLLGTFYASEAITAALRGLITLRTALDCGLDEDIVQVARFTQKTATDATQMLSAVMQALQPRAEESLAAAAQRIVVERDQAKAEALAAVDGLRTSDTPPPLLDALCCYDALRRGREDMQEVLAAAGVSEVIGEQVSDLLALALNDIYGDVVRPALLTALVGRDGRDG